MSIDISTQVGLNNSGQSGGQNGGLGAGVDVNDSRFHLLLSASDWFGWQGSVAKVSHSEVTDPDVESEPDLIWDEASASLMLRPLLFRFQAAASDLPLTVDARRGAARDRFGNWYWIDEAGTGIRFLPACQKESEHFWSGVDVPAAVLSPPTMDFAPLEPPAPFGAVSLRGLTVTGHHYLVVGVLKTSNQAAGLLIFDLHAGGEPQCIRWPDVVPFAPLDLSPAPHNGVWILDANGRYWGLDGLFQLITTDQVLTTLVPEQSSPFHTEGEAAETTSAVTFPQGIPLNFPEGFTNPISIEGLDDGSVLLASHDPPVMCRYRLGTRISGMVNVDDALQEALEPDPAHPYLLHIHDIAFIADAAGTSAYGRLTGTLYVVGEDGNQAFAFTLMELGSGFHLEPQARYLPMRLFTGRALVRYGDTIYYDQKYAGQNVLWPKLVEQPIRRYEQRATLEMTGAFDGREPGCVWHRLLIDACIPAGASVQLESRAADFAALLERTPWQVEPKPYRRGNGAEVPWYRPYDETQAQRPEYGTFELLLQRATGRFLQLRLTLTSTGRTSPRLRALRVYYPRFSYLREYLPAVYSEDPTSASFLDRFLANIEGQYTSLEGRIAQAQMLLDVSTVPPDMLDWLAGWFGVVLDPSWQEWRRRLFLRHVMTLFRTRGTSNGLLMAIRLAIDDCVDDCLFQDGIGRDGAVAYGSGQNGTGTCTSCTDQSGVDCSGQLERFPVRVVERFRTRLQPGVAFGDPTETIVPGFSSSSWGVQESSAGSSGVPDNSCQENTESVTWTPAQGSEPLHLRYQTHLRVRLGLSSSSTEAAKTLNARWGLKGEAELQSLSDVLFSPIVPANALEVPDWRTFLQEGLGFVHVELTNATGATPTDTATLSTSDGATADGTTSDMSKTESVPVSTDTQRWRKFLLGRYRRITALNEAWGLKGSAAYQRFDQILLPTVYPEGGRYLYDWIQLVSLAEPIRARAHQFSLLVPVRPELAPEEIQRRLEVAAHIVELERPAHTRFEVKPYWALFRAGEARLGIDTVLGEGSRYVALLLGGVALTEGVLTPSHPFNVPDRSVVGRDTAGAQPRL